MKLRWRRTIAALLAIVMVFSIPGGLELTAAAVEFVEESHTAVNTASYTPEGEHYSLEISGGVITKFEALEGFDGAVTIPSAIQGQAVTEIGEGAFFQCESLTDIVLPEGLTAIGLGAFLGCGKLARIELPESLTTIGISAFSNCDSLTDIELPERLTSIGTGAFEQSGLTGAVIPDGVTSIPDTAFYGCVNLSHVTLPATLTAIGERSFSGCIRLSEIQLPDDLDSIGDDAFSYCESLTSAELPEGLTDLGSGAFSYSGLTSVAIPGGIRELSSSLFANCGDLASVIIPDGVERIGPSAFKDCVLLTSVTVPGSVTGIDSAAFRGCTGLTNVTIEEGATSIGDWAFLDCTALTGATIPASVTSIGSQIFANCHADLVIYGVPGSAAETYANENGLTFRSLAGGRNLSVAVLEPDGTDVTAAVTITWFDGETMVRTGPNFSGAEKEKSYTYAIALPDSLAERYQQPEAGMIQAGAGDVTETVTLEVKPLTLTGQVTADWLPLSGATVTVTPVEQGEGAPLLVETGSDGTFTMTGAPRVPVTISIQAEGYFSRTTVEDLSSAKNAYDIGTWNLTALPPAWITLEITRQQAAQAGETAEEFISAVSGLKFTVSDSSGTPVTDFVISGASLSFGAEANLTAGKELTVSVTDPTGAYSAAAATVTLNENKTAHAKLTMVQNGGFVLRTISGPEADYMVFDDAGRGVRYGRASAGVVVDNLAEGDYTLVLVQENKYFSALANVRLLDSFGMTAGRDYWSGTVHIQQGVITSVSNCVVPEFDGSAFYWVVESGVTADSPVAAGNYVMVQVSYELFYLGDEGAQALQVALPGGLSLAGDTVTLNGQETAYAESGDGTITIDMQGQPEGTLCFYCVAVESGMQTVSASVVFDGGILQPLGSAAIQVEEASLNVPTKVSESTDLLASGKAAPDSTITLYDNGVKVADGVRANQVGSWSTFFDLAQPTYSASYHNLYAVIQTPDPDAPPITTQTQCVAYSQAYPGQVSTISIYNARDGGQETVLDFTSGSTAVPYYKAWTSGTFPFTFRVDFTQNADQLTEVYVVTSSGGEETWIPTQYDATLDAWVGNYTYEDYRSLPTEVRAAYRSETGGREIAAKLDLEQYKDAVQAYDGLRDRLEVMFDETLEGLYEFGEPEISYSEADDAWLSIKLDLMFHDSETGESQSAGYCSVGYEQLTMDEAELEAADYYVIDAADNIWCKLEYNSPGVVTYYADVGEKKLYTYGMHPDAAVASAVSYALSDDGTWEEILSETANLLTLIPVFGNSADVVKSLIDMYGELNVWWIQLSGNVEMLTMKKESIKEQYLMAQCENKQFRLSYSDYDYLLRRANVLESAIKEYQINGTALLMTMVIQDALYSYVSGKCFGAIVKKNGIGDAAKKPLIEDLNKKLKTLNADQIAWRKRVIDDMDNVCERGLQYGVEKVSGLVSDKTGVTAKVENAPIPLTFAARMDTFLRSGYCTIDRDLDALISDIVAAYDCPGDSGGSGDAGKPGGSGTPGDEPTPNRGDFTESQTKRVSRIIDPSGYVYEAVPSNRLEGVTATIVYLGDDGQPTLWNAGDYDQLNPQYTGTDGAYRWDVPEGKWKVIFSKDGYENATSEEVAKAKDSSYADGWLPVPPPQLEINVGMVSTSAPEVRQAVAYTDRIEVVFSQYMDIESVRNAVALTRGGEAVSAKITALDAEYDLEGTTQYAVRFAVEPADGDCTGTVEVAATAENYAGTPLDTACSQTLEAPVQRPTAITAGELSLVVHQEGALAVSLVDGAEGTELTVESLTPGLLSVSSAPVTTGADGSASIALTGTLPGVGRLRVTEPVSGLSETFEVCLVLSEDQLPDAVKPEAVTAALRDGTAVTTGMTVAQGAQIVLSTATQGAAIRYTLDDTCPCAETALPYDGPITITKDTVLRAAAVLDGVYSDTIRLELSVKTEPSGTGGTGGGGSSSVSYRVETADADHGALTVSPTRAGKGDTVTITVTPDEGYELGALTVTDGAGREVELTAAGSSQYRFIMPDSRVTIDAEFVPAEETAIAFTDVDAGDYFYDAVLWAVADGVTVGTTGATFSPDAVCTRAQAVTFLWRAAGSPQPESANPFVDVQEEDYYYDAVLWAVENHITAGTDAGAFSPDAVCTRSQVVTFLYRYGGTAATTQTEFVDVSETAYYYQAVQWAAQNGITSGTGANAFSPDAVCTRAQIVTLLYRALEK